MFRIESVSAEFGLVHRVTLRITLRSTSIRQYAERLTVKQVPGTLVLHVPMPDSYENTRGVAVGCAVFGAGVGAAVGGAVGTPVIGWVGGVGWMGGGGGNGGDVVGGKMVVSVAV
jgi:hypothetical protein